MPTADNKDKKKTPFSMYNEKSIWFRPQKWLGFPVFFIFIYFSNLNNFFKKFILYYKKFRVFSKINIKYSQFKQFKKKNYKINLQILTSCKANNFNNFNNKNKTQENKTNFPISIFMTTMINKENLNLHGKIL